MNYGSGGWPGTALRRQQDLRPDDPLRIANLLCWLRADAITGYANSAALPMWPDVSGNGFHFYQQNATMQPLYRTNIVNGLPAVQFDASNDSLGYLLLDRNPYSVFLVTATLDAAAGSLHRALGGTNNWLLSPYQGFWGHYNQGWFNGATGPAVVAGQFKAMAGVQDDNLAQFWLSGSLLDSHSIVGPPGWLYMGGGEGYAVQPLNGYVAEMMVYRRRLAVDEIGAVFQYLQRKYGI